MPKVKIVTLERDSEVIDVNKEFRRYKYAISEHPPIALSTGNYIHIYRVTEYEWNDLDEEQESFDREMY